MLYHKKEVINMKQQIFGLLEVDPFLMIDSKIAGLNFFT